MSILKIARMGHPVLRAKTRRLDRREIRMPAIQALVDDMIVTMGEYGGIGLAAPQVHRDLRLFVAALEMSAAQSDAGQVLVLFNPEVTVVGDEVAEDWEGCLSIPAICGLVPRPREITIAALDRDGNRVELRARDFVARVIQHECDHLDGVLYIDRMRSPQSLAYEDQRRPSTPPFLSY